MRNWKIANCIEYDDVNKICSKCFNDYVLAANGLSCDPITVIPHCAWYEVNVS